jgi:superfamily II DNA or RNA helicase
MLRFLQLDPNTAYVGNNLLLPRNAINEAVVKASLTFQLSEEEPMVDEFGQLIAMRAATLKMWSETAHHLVIPREFLREDQYEQFNFPFVVLPRPAYEVAGIGDRIALRDAEQEEAFRVMMRSDSGTINLSCGKGKTVIALKVAAALNRPTIVVVNTTALLEQWKEEIYRHLDVPSVGIVQGTTIDWRHPITVSMVHTLSSRQWPMEFRRYFGLVLYDEGHHMSAPVFVKSADLFYGRRFSLTATATRTDGLERIYQYHLGPVIHTNLSQELIPHTIFHVLDWELPIQDRKKVLDKYQEVNTAKVRTYLGSLDWRNDIIYQHLRNDLAEGRNILVLSHSVEHVDRLHSYLSGAGGGMIIGETPQENRMAILHHCNPVFGTFQLAREGLNKPSLDTLYIVTSFGNSNDLQQAWGRIQRIYPNKLAPIVRVFEDLAFSCTKKNCNHLRYILRKLDYPYEVDVGGNNAR